MNFLAKTMLARLTAVGWLRAATLFFKGFTIAAVLTWLVYAQAANAVGYVSVAQVSTQEMPSEPSSQQLKIYELEKVIALNPSSDTAWNNLGQTLFVAQQYAGALTAYDHALVISPDYSLALANRCGVLSRLKDYDQALMSCELALKGDGRWGAQGSARAWNNRGDALFNLKQYTASLQAFEKAILVNPAVKSAWYNRQLALSRIQRQ